MELWPGRGTERPLLIAITDLERLQQPINDWGNQLFAGGVDLIQIRQPDWDDKQLIGAIEQIVSVSPDLARVQINGRPDLAKRFGCGVHLPERVLWESTLPRPASRSVHGIAAAERSSMFDFVVAGHVFDTPSHACEPARGTEWLAHIVTASPVPVVAIGGIDATNAVSCFEAGANGIAVIRALTSTNHPYESARALREILDAFNGKPEESMSASESITIVLNGKSVDLPANSTVQALLNERELIDRLVVVEINGTIVARSNFSETFFNDGDIVEMVHFVGGG